MWPALRQRNSKLNEDSRSQSARSLGGTARLANLVLACNGCNHCKSNLSESAWVDSARLHNRRVDAFRKELRRLGHKDDGAYWHRGRLLYVEVNEGGWGVAECDRCGARGLPAELGARPCLLTAE